VRILGRILGQVHALNLPGGLRHIRRAGQGKVALYRLEQ
jgi:hypothetical protein